MALPTQKQVIINVTSPADGSLLATWKNAQLEGFTKELNAGVGECILKLDKVFDYGGSDLSVGNFIEIRISDKDTLAGALRVEDTAGARIIYTGYISLIEREIIGNKEQVRVHCLGHYTKLATDILKNGTQTTLYSYASGLTVTSGDMDACDIGTLMQAIIDRYIAETTNPKISYDSTDIPLTATVATYAFEQKTYRESMDILKKIAPVGTYYYVDELGKVKFKPTPTTPTHKFVFGRHFNSVRVEQSMEKVRNFLLVWNGETGGAEVYKHYQDDDSIAKYGRRSQTVNDYGIDNTDAADLMGIKFLAENKTPEVKVTCTIIDNNENNFGYDIESIQPGDTCSFYGFSSGLSDIFRDNMIITKVNYSLDQVEIEVQVIKSGLLDFQEQQGKQIGDIGTGGLNIPDIYT